MSKIEWTEKTWNPIIGCRKASPGCANCYAEKMAHRLAAMGTEVYQDVVNAGRWNGKQIASSKQTFDKPLRRKKPTVYFVNSMSDLFLHTSAQAKSILHSIWHTMAMRPQHTFQILTKYPENMIKNLRYVIKVFGVLPNVWLGVSVENQKYAVERIPVLLKVPAAVRFVSAEPLLGKIDITRWLPDIDWVIVGGESGPNARQMDPDWVHSIRRQCACSGSETPFFFKQWGKKRAGRLLNGREWNEMPVFQKSQWLLNKHIGKI